MKEITPTQSRVARAWLDWSQDDLAQRAGVSSSTVRDFEKGRRKPIGNNMAALVTALQRGGVTFKGEGKVEFQTPQAAA